MPSPPQAHGSLAAYLLSERQPSPLGAGNGLLPQVSPVVNYPGEPAALNPAHTGAGVPGFSEDNHVNAVSEHLLQALGQVQDPSLRSSLTTAFAALQKHAAQRQKEHEQALAGKLSPRLMREAYAAEHHGQMPHLPHMGPHLPVVAPNHIAAAYSHAPAPSAFAAE